LLQLQEGEEGWHDEQQILHIVELGLFSSCQLLRRMIHLVADDKERQDLEELLLGMAVGQRTGTLENGYLVNQPS
jgi:hypothetical protein